MEKIWLEHYPQHVTANIELNTFSSLLDAFDRAIREFTHRPALASMGTTIDYATFDRIATQLAAYFQHALKLKRGDRIALMMPNILQYPIAVLAALRAGLIVVSINPLYTPRELEHQLKDAQVDTIIILENFAQTLQHVLPRTSVRNIIMTKLGDLLSFPKNIAINFAVKHIKKMIPKWKLPNPISFTEALKIGRRHTFTPITLTHEDIAFLQYTGGTTGIAKGVMLTHGNLLANMLQARSWILKDLKEGEETILTALPLYHVFALTANLLTFSSIGALSVLIVNPRDIATLIKTINRYKITVMTGVNTLFNALLNHPTFSSINFDSWKISLSAGMAIQQSVASRWQQHTGLTLIEAYGLTEASPAVCMNPLDLKEFNGCVGLPLPDTEVEIRDHAGQQLPIGQSGELWVKGPQVMKGYWQRPEETRKVIDERGFLDTGDMALITPQGFVKLVDRKKDMILVSGFNVYPNEIEDVIAAHPSVLEVACVGVPDEKSGEAVKVCVVKKDPNLTQELILQYCKTHLTGYKIPKYIEFHTELPKSNVGKILRRELRPDAHPTQTMTKV